MIKKLKRVISKRFLKKSSSKVILTRALCYHSISGDNWEGKVAHRISKENFAAQLRILKRQDYTFLKIDEYLESKSRKKVTSVTFDDGYRDLHTNALEVLVDEGIPFTLFLNGCLLSGEILWRDMIRILIESSLVNEFYEYLLVENSDLALLIDKSNFYRSTKKNGVNSELLTGYIKSYLSLKSVSLIDNSLYVNREVLESLPNDLFSLGNHSWNHYRLSTLSKNQLKKEITSTEELINSIRCNKSRVFSIPFGGNDSFSQDMIDILKDLDYLGFLTTDHRPFVPQKYGMDDRGLLHSNRILLNNEPQILG